MHQRRTLALRRAIRNCAALLRLLARTMLRGIAATSSRGACACCAATLFAFRGFAAPYFTISFLQNMAAVNSITRQQHRFASGALCWHLAVLVRCFACRVIAHQQHLRNAPSHRHILRHRGRALPSRMALAPARIGSSRAWHGSYHIALYAFGWRIWFCLLPRIA